MSNGAAGTTDKEAECNEEETETDLFAELEDGLALPDVNNMEQCIQFLTGNDNVHRDLSAAGEDGKSLDEGDACNDEDGALVVEKDRVRVAKLWMSKMSIDTKLHKDYKLVQSKALEKFKKGNPLKRHEKEQY